VELKKSSEIFAVTTSARAAVRRLPVANFRPVPGGGPGNGQPCRELLRQVDGRLLAGKPESAIGAQSMEGNRTF